MIHCIGNDAVLNAADAGRKALVVSVYRETGLPSVQVLLDAIGILVGPLSGLAVTHEEVIF